MTMRISDAGVELVKRWEGLRLRAYLCPAGVPTIGYGHTKTVTARDVNRKRLITHDEAEALLRSDLEAFEAVVNKTPGLTQHQFDACVSLAFNIGASAFQRSTLRRLLLAGQHAAAAEQFGRWIRAKGQVLPGLISRRADERRLFLISE